MAEWHGRCAVELLESRFAGTRGDLAWVRAALADALRVNGKLTEARAQLDLCSGSAGRWVAPMVQGLVLVSDAELALAETNRVRAAASAERARRIFTGCADVGSEPWRRLQAVTDGLAAPKLTVSVGSVPTTGELRVLELLAVTPNRAQIARELYLSESTVKTHLRRIYRRFGAANRDEALAAARARGLLGSGLGA
jgi:ATP/maltotriose-dependent transcriptional regulator MalT